MTTPGALELSGTNGRVLYLPRRLLPPQSAARFTAFEGGCLSDSSPGLLSVTQLCQHGQALCVSGPLCSPLGSEGLQTAASDCS